MELETRTCKKAGCLRTWKCLPGSKNDFCSILHSPDYEQLSTFSFSAQRYSMVRKWIIEEMGPLEVEGEKDDRD